MIEKDSFSAFCTKQTSFVFIYIYSNHKHSKQNNRKNMTRICHIQQSGRMALPRKEWIHVHIF